MKLNSVLTLMLVVAACFAESGLDAQNNINASNRVAEPPAIDALLALDKQATEAYFKSDTKFFDSLLSEKFVMRQGAQRLDKAATLKMIADNKCDVRTWNLDEPWMAKIDGDTYVLSYRSTYDGTCTGADGKPAKIPSPTRAATIWVRSSGKWLAAFHGENPIIDPKDSSKSALPPAQLAKQTEAKSTDPSTDALAAVEKSVWEAWRAHDTKKLQDLTSGDLSFIDIFGNSYSNKADTIKAWAGSICEVKSVSVTDAVATTLSPTVKLLMHTGRADGTCFGEKVPPVRGNSVYVKDGEAWKLAFTMNMPATDLP
jgi:ketosteroid isomerase-like protein